jgi:hypothetical protein
VTKLRDRAIAAVAKMDEEQGESWSDDTAALVTLLETFTQEHLDEVLEIMRKGTVNRRWPKSWEENIKHFCTNKKDT